MLVERVRVGAMPMPTTVSAEQAPALHGKNRILLLQGPVGGFFSRLEGELELAGWSVTRAVFNQGDQADAGSRRTVAYRGSLAAFDQWLRHLLLTQNYAAIILFGAERPLHAAARRLAKGWGVPVLCLEEGYIRSGYITAEFGGNNWQSPVAGHLPSAAELDAALRALGPQKGYNSFPAMCLSAARYFVRRRLGASRHVKGCFHKSRPLMAECFYWARNFWRYKTGQGRNFRSVEKLLEHHDGRFFIVPLQVRDDSQLGAAAAGWNSQSLIDTALRSYAQHARADQQIVFKIHPLERGHSNQRRAILRLAAELSIADRVHVLDSGSLGLLVRHCAGMITINSTSGFSALAHNRPLLVLGHALYRHRDLAACYTQPEDMHAFWQQPPARAARLANGYIAWIKQHCLLPGDFYVPAGQATACESIVTLLAETIPVAQAQTSDGRALTAA
ncbi:capsular biosynthesis protein [Aureimonas frigidaquae]|uniref:Capsule polysaccharide biosynthesis n=1 Tax=Aureimonas frigidaquae TaxID=424757 RepID=A0A0P0Z2Q4_9HYPH|nr:capsular biosynthesis protein [Aureimonas frigidaquae]BAT28216.1 capsule polysaccharide biosynthesis precursor [Aureimonas frigidaquae]